MNGSYASYLWLAFWILSIWGIGKATKSWIIRIGGGLLISLIALMLVSTVVAPRRNDPEMSAKPQKTSKPTPQDDFWARGERKLKAQQEQRVNRAAESSLGESRAIALVYLTPAKRGGTIKDFFERQSRVPALTDLGWSAQPTTDGFVIQKTVKADGLSGTSIYRWKVSRDEKVIPINGKAMDITLER